MKFIYKTAEQKYRAVWILTMLSDGKAFTVSSGPETYSLAHRLLTAASARGRTGWVEEVVR
jgi:hypothetical protein